MKLEGPEVGDELMSEVNSRHALDSSSPKMSAWCLTPPALKKQEEYQQQATLRRQHVKERLAKRRKKMQHRMSSAASQILGPKMVHLHRRKIRNREAAAVSRLRKQTKLVELEKRNQALEHRNRILEQRIALLEKDPHVAEPSFQPKEDPLMLHFDWPSTSEFDVLAKLVAQNTSQYHQESCPIPDHFNWTLEPAQGNVFHPESAVLTASTHLKAKARQSCMKMVVSH